VRGAAQRTLIPAMAEVGERFERQDLFVPEMLVAARAMKCGIEVLPAAPAGRGRQTDGHRW